MWGKNNISLQVVSIYQPCTNEDGVTSAWVQHKAHPQDLNDDRDPRVAFREDPQQQIQEWVDRGDQLIIGGDVNESVLHPSVASMFQETGLVNSAFSIHSPEQAPTTHYQHGSNKVIDGIWSTTGIRIQRGGHLEPREAPGDHSLVWIDISYEDALGHNPPQSVSPSARCLKLCCPKVVDKHLKEYECLIKIHQLERRQYELESSTTIGAPLTPDQEQEAEAIDQLRTQCMLKAEQKCRKLRTGMVAFSPKVAKYLRQIAFWDIAIARRLASSKEGSQNTHQVSSRLWRRKKKAAKITHPTAPLSLEEMQALRRKAKKGYKRAKRKHKENREDFLDKLPPKIRDRLKRVEQQRELGQLAKAVTGKLESKSVTKIEHNEQEMTSRKT